MATEAKFILLLSFLLLVSSANASVEDVCKTAARTPKVDYNFCVSSLRSAPGSESATNQGLAVIAGTLAANQAKTIKSKVASLLKKNTDPKLKSPLESCAEVYDDVVSTVKDATNAVKRNDTGDAKTWFSAAVDAPSTCEQGFQEKSLPSPLSKEDNVMLQLTSIALSITVSL